MPATLALMESLAVDAPSGKGGGGVDDARLEEILERTAEFFESYLWESRSGHSIRSRLADAGVEESTLRRFRIGYAPEGHKALLDHLAQWGYSPAELHAAGVATESGRGRLHAHFRSRVMFPVRERQRPDRLASSVSPPISALRGRSGRRPPRRASTARARRSSRSIRPARRSRKRGRARVLNDCLEVLRLHQRGDREAVAVVQSPITQEHLAQLAAELPVEPGEVGLLRQPGRGKGAADVLIVGPHSELGEGAFFLDEDDQGAVLAADRAPGAADSAEPEPGTTWRSRILQGLGSAVIGFGVPLGWFLVVRPSGDDPGGPTTGFGATVIGVVATYLLLGVIVAFVSARTHRRSTERRMRAPWEHGATEWQPRAWTYHQLEEVLIAAALLSIVVCVVMFVTIGGFGG